MNLIRWVKKLELDGKRKCSVFERGLVAEACKAAVKARNLGWMYTIWVVQGPPDDSGY